MLFAVLVDVFGICFVKYCRLWHPWDFQHVKFGKCKTFFIKTSAGVRDKLAYINLEVVVLTMCWMQSNKCLVFKKDLTQAQIAQ